MSFEASNDEDIDKIVKHTVDNIQLEHLQDFIERFGSIEGFQAALKENLKDDEIEANLIKLYGGKEQAVAGSLSGNESYVEN